MVILAYKTRTDDPRGAWSRPTFTHFSDSLRAPPPRARTCGRTPPPHGARPHRSDSPTLTTFSTRYLRSGRTLDRVLRPAQSFRHTSHDRVVHHPPSRGALESTSVGETCTPISGCSVQMSPLEFPPHKEGARPASTPRRNGGGRTRGARVNER